MEKISILTKNGRKEIKLEGDQGICYNCEIITTDVIPTQDSAVHFCLNCYNDYYCLKCGIGLEDHVLYHPKCKPDNVIICDE